MKKSYLAPCAALIVLETEDTLLLSGVLINGNEEDGKTKDPAVDFGEIELW